MTAANATECTRTLKQCYQTAKTLTNTYKNATDQTTAVAPGRELCNNINTNQEYCWTMTIPGVPNHMTAGTECTKNAKQTPTYSQDTNRHLQKMLLTRLVLGRQLCNNYIKDIKRYAAHQNANQR